MMSEETHRMFAATRRDIIEKALAKGVSEKRLFQPIPSFGRKLEFPPILTRFLTLKEPTSKKNVLTFKDTGPKRGARLFDQVAKTIIRFSSQVLVLAGEFNYQSYSALVHDHKFDELVKQSRTSVFVIGGPHISVRSKKAKSSQDPKDVNPILDLARRKLIKLYLKKEKREVGHFIVGTYTDIIVLQEDPHLEYENWNTNLYYDDPARCQSLRKRFNDILISRQAFPWDLDLGSIRDRFMTMKELRQLSQKT